MRIAIVCSYYPWPPSVGGVETIVRSVSTELAKRGHEVHVVTTPFDVTTGRQVSDYGVEERDSVIVHKLKPGKVKVGYARLLKGLKETIEKIKPEIVHEHNLHPQLFQLAKWKNEVGYRLFAELHHPAVELDFLIQRLMMPFAVAGLKRISRAVDAFIAHTILEREWLISKGISSGKVAIVRFPAIPSRLINYGGRSTRLGDIAYLGRIVRRKGLHVLLNALSTVKHRLGEFKANIAGPQDANYLETLKMLIKRLNLEDNVSFVGIVEEEEKYGFIKSHKTFVLPSFKEYTPCVLLEAQALGVPVIATRVGAVPEMMINGETGLLVRPGNELELAKGIEILIREQDLRRRFSLNARKFAENFVLERQIDKLETLYLGSSVVSIGKQSYRYRSTKRS
nr:glycosyltransferase family 1 protein [Candidatus Bathyarchaeota archaeon]